MNAIEMLLDPLLKKYGFDPEAIKNQILSIQKSAREMNMRMQRIEEMCEKLIIDRGLKMPQGFVENSFERTSVSDRAQ